MRTAALLRKDGDYRGALALLDQTVLRFVHDDVVSAAYACAVAVHCDTNDAVTAIKVGQARLADHRSPALENALARAYWERFEETGEDEDLRAWKQFRATMGTSDPEAVAV